MTDLSKKLEKHRAKIGNAHTVVDDANIYRALLELAIAVDAVESAQLNIETSRKATPDADRGLLHNDLACAYFDMRAALARLAEAMR